MSKLQKIFIVIGIIFIFGSLGMTPLVQKYGGFGIAQPYRVTNSGSKGAGAATTTEFIGSVNPQVDNLYDLGTSTLRWRKAVIAGQLTVGSCVGCGGGSNAGNFFTTSSNNLTIQPIQANAGISAVSSSFTNSTSTNLFANFFQTTTGTVNGDFTGMGASSTVFSVNGELFAGGIDLASSSVSGVPNIRPSGCDGCATGIRLTTTGVDLVGSNGTTLTGSNFFSIIGGANPSVKFPQSTGPTPGVNNTQDWASSALSIRRFYVSSTLIDGGDLIVGTSTYPNLYTSGLGIILQVNGVASSTGMVFASGTSTFTFTLPNGGSPIFNSIGEIGFDTTDNQLLITSSTNNDPLVLPTVQKIWGVTIASTSQEFINGGRLPLPTIRDGFKITEMDCYVVGGTSVVLNLDTVAGGSNTDSITCGTSNTVVTPMTSNFTIAAQTPMAAEVGAITGTVNYVSIAIYGQYARK